jgi:hypothetical protein
MNADQQKECRERLLELVEAGNRLRNTAIVDDEFPLARDRFDSALVRANQFLKDSK